jgi:hypothetical protein
MMKRSQTMLEYSILLVIIIAALLVMQVYMKRGFQGRWKQAMDDVGDQYDVESFNSSLRWTLNSTTESQLFAKPYTTNAGTINGLMTYRNDTSHIVEQKIGNSMTGSGQ